MIQLKQVSFAYPGLHSQKLILDQYSLEIKQGSFNLLQAPSGCGKSTLLALIAGLLRPTEGEIYVADQQVSRLPDPLAAAFRREHIGFVFQRFQLIPDMSVHQNLKLPLIPGQLSHTEIRQRIFELLERYDLTSLYHAPVSTLSGGEQQRVAICRALVNQPTVLLADEPTANLDLSLKKTFLAQLEELKASGVTLLLASHEGELSTHPLFDFHIEFPCS